MSRQMRDVTGDEDPIDDLADRQMNTLVDSDRREDTAFSQDPHATGAFEKEFEKGGGTSSVLPPGAASASISKPQLRSYRWRIITTLFLPMLVWSLNKTVIAAALPFIASDFNQFAQLNWIIGAAELTSAAFVPAWGQFADIFGRYVTLQASVMIVVVSSALCAGSPTNNFPMLLAGRGIQGVGTAGIMILTSIILSDKAPGVGPVLGGVLTSVTWRWCFIVNIPIGVLGPLFAHSVARPVVLGPQNLPERHGADPSSPSQSLWRRLCRVDWGGQLLFLFGVGLIVLALTWAGTYYPWRDVKVLVPLILGSALMMVFLVWECLLLPGRQLAVRYPNQNPLIPLHLLWTRNAGVLMYINLITGMSMYAVLYFVGLYFAIVLKFGSTQAGANLLYYLPGAGAGSYLAMFACNVWPRKTWHPLFFGTIAEALGITLLAAALRRGHPPTIYGMLTLTGVGTGIGYMPNTLHGVGYYRTQIASVVSLMSLAVELGSTLASTIMLNIFNNELNSAGINLVGGPSSASGFGSLDQMPGEAQKYFRQHARDGLVVAFYSISSFMWLGVVGMVFLGNVNIRKDSTADEGPRQNETQGGSFTQGAYLPSLLRRHREGVGGRS